MKKYATCLFALIGLLLGCAIVLPSLIIMELLSSQYAGRLSYRFDILGYRFWNYVSPETVYIIGKPDLDSTLETYAHFQAECRSFRQQYITLLKLAYKDFLYEWYKKEDRKLLVTLDTDASNPFYKETFKFLKHYFGVYRILPGILPVDKYGILHIKIDVLERKNDNLTIEELEKGLHIRLVNTLMNSNDLIDIPFGYWSISTVYFPDLEKNLENDHLVIMLALSKAGSNRIMALRDEKEHTTCDDLEETL